ncbi:MAG: alpha/beta fold hydrolase [Acidobacteriota bacterium]|nr:alpha/beta fold hydrolase [Acidobacteriota bacterium]MDH3529007.1 alpha/beta fold hydrolase [Acidobacteriota bacterium]
MKALFVSTFVTAILLLSVGCSLQTQEKRDIADGVEQPETIMPEQSVFDPVPVRFESEDGLEIAGSFWDAPRKESGAILLLHQWGSDRRSFHSLGTALRHLDIASLAIDGRGFGESVKTKDGNALKPERSKEAVNGMMADVDAAIRFLSEKKNIEKSRIGIVGASYGSSLALIYAARNKEVKTVVLLSPGMNYFGNLQLDSAIKEYGNRPLLILAAEDDKASADAVRNLERMGANDKYEVKIFADGGHGTDMMRIKTKREKEITDFLEKNL